MGLASRLMLQLREVDTEAKLKTSGQSQTHWRVLVWYLSSTLQLNSGFPRNVIRDAGTKANHVGCLYLPKTANVVHIRYPNLSLPYLSVLPSKEIICSILRHYISPNRPPAALLGSFWKLDHIVAPSIYRAW